MAYMVLAARFVMSNVMLFTENGITNPFVLKVAGSKLDTSVKLPLTGGTATSCGW